MGCSRCSFARRKLDRYNTRGEGLPVQLMLLMKQRRRKVQLLLYLQMLYVQIGIITYQSSLKRKGIVANLVVKEFPGLYSNSLRSNEYKEFIFNSGANQGEQTELAAEVSSGQSQRFYKVSSIKYTIS